MKRTAAILIVLFASLSIQGQASNTQPNYEFSNGNWFDGRTFVARNFYSVAGVLTDRKPPRVDRMIDLAGKFIVPPFGEAHNHNLDWSDDERWAQLRRRYLEGGIFYVKNPNSLPRSKTSLAGKINIPNSLDGTFSNGGLTATGGHPIEIVTPRRGFQPGDGEGGFYFVIDTLADLDRKWPAIIAGKPDFIKTYLLYSEEYSKRKDDHAYDDWKGLDPMILREIVRRAHRAGLRVSTHVETAADFHNALLARVDEINHTPGFRPEKNDVTRFTNLARYEISDDDARLAARNRVVVVTTMGESIDWTYEGKESESQRLAVRAMLVHNLQQLKKFGVAVAIGSDNYRATSVPEALSLARLQVFDNATLLRMWCETTAATIFPGRKIGQLKAGYEASFLVLSENPLKDFSIIKKIESRFKQGELLTP